LLLMSRQQFVALGCLLWVLYWHLTEELQQPLVLRRQPLDLGALVGNLLFCDRHVLIPGVAV
jgi:hypothetical protein